MRPVPPNPAARAACAAALALGTLTLSGCQSSVFKSSPLKTNPFAHRVEKRTVSGFAEALAEADAEALAKLSSPDFRTTALSDEEAIAEVQRLWPVKGKLEIVAVKDVPEDELRTSGVPEKLVTVKDERGWKTDHRLVRDPDSKKWVVDEILITNSQRGLTATKTISEQVVFVSVVREFTEAWRDGDRDRRLASVTAECRAELEPLPDDVLDHLAARIFPEDADPSPPEATMDEDIALVLLRRSTDAVVLEMKRIDGGWLVDDVQLDDTGEGEAIPSLRETAVAYAAATKFLAAYSAADREALATVATKPFYEATLKAADLSDVPLPPAAAASESGRLKVVGKQGELVIEEGERTVKLALVRTDDEQDVQSVTEFRVEDVTLYEENGAVKKRLAAALVAEPLAHLYADALIARDVGQLQVMATHDFRDLVWKRVTPQMAATLPLANVRPGKREVLSVVHDGAATEVTMMQADRAMTYVLKDEGGEVKVDDVLMAVADRPASLKTTLVHMLPVVRLREALAAGDVEAIREDCSSDFNRLIWSQVRQVPPHAAAAVRFLDAPLASLQVGGSEATVRLGDANYGGVVSLLQDRGRWRVHDVTIVAGPSPQDQAALKPLLRDALANGTLFADASPSGASPVTADAGAIQQVTYEVASPPVEPAPTPSPVKEPRPLDLGAEAAPIPRESTPAAKPQQGSALPFSEPLW